MSTSAGLTALTESLGNSGVLHPETARFLAENGLDRADYLASNWGVAVAYDFHGQSAVERHVVSDSSINKQEY